MANDEHLFTSLSAHPNAWPIFILGYLSFPLSSKSSFILTQASYQLYDVQLFSPILWAVF